MSTHAAGLDAATSSQARAAGRLSAEVLSAMTCRACSGPLRAAFDGKVLGDIDVTYCACTACGTLQLPAPHWLERAYALQHKPDPDSGRLMRALAVHRVIRRLRALRLLPGALRVLDEGAGMGLLVRLLRDQGIEAWGHDPYAAPVMAEPFVVSQWPEGQYGLITATEVIEHTEATTAFVRDLAARLAPGGVLLLTTELFDAARIADPPNWPYLAQPWGQHITFLSRSGLDAVAAQAGLQWWCSLDFGGSPCIHLLGRSMPSRWTLHRLQRRHAQGELRSADDKTV